MNIRTRAAAALALTALTASATLGACAGPGTGAGATLSAPVPAVQQDATPAGLPDGALKGQVASTTAITLIIKNGTGEVWNLRGQAFTGDPNTRFASVLGPHEADRAVVNSFSLDGASISVSYFNADQTAKLEAFADVPLFGKDYVIGTVYKVGELGVHDPRYTVTTSDISGYTPTVTLTISYA